VAERVSAGDVEHDIADETITVQWFRRDRSGVAALSDLEMDHQTENMAADYSATNPREEENKEGEAETNPSHDVTEPPA
jgi:hypothetical protein